MRNNKKKGFTLSETLLTLVIIGVVSALTIPVIYGNYMWAERSTKVKNFSKIINNAIDEALIANDGKHFIGYAGHSGKGETGYYHHEVIDIMNHIRPYLPITEECGFETDGNCSFNGEYKYFSKKKTGEGVSRNTNLWYKFNLSDGSHVYFFANIKPYIQLNGLFFRNVYEIEYDMN